MAVEIINKADESTVSDSKKFTGMIPYHVLAINPTKDELHQAGLTFIKTEPNYQREFGEEKRKTTLVDIWLKSAPNPKHPDLDMVTKLTFFIDNTPFTSKNTGKKQYVNKYGRTAWALEPEDLNTNQYFINDDSRQGFRGEEDLYKFLFAWLNMTYDAERKILNPCRIEASKLFSGDYSELQQLATQAKAYVVKVLTGVRKVEGDDGSVKYFTTTYNRYFLKHNQKSIENIQNYIKKSEYNEFKDAISYSFAIKEFNIEELPDDEQPAINVGTTSHINGSDPF